MQPFELFSVGRLIFGSGTFERIGELAGPLGRNALIIYNGAAVYAEHLRQLLQTSDIQSTLRKQSGEPVVADVDAAVEQARSAGADMLIGLGGGSAIDAAKAVAGLLTNGGQATDYMEVVGRGQKITKPAAPFIAIPTTAGTGAEATRNAVVGLPEKKFKASIRSEHLLPRIALIDPSLGVNVSPEVTARSGMDALCQLIESYTSTGARELTDALALRGIVAARSLARAFQDGRNLAAREDMALAAYLSGVTLTNAGLGAVHGFAAPLGANFPAPHGAICAALLPHIIAANVQALTDTGNANSLARYATVGRLLARDERLPDPAAIQFCISFTADLAREFRIPPLCEFSMALSDIPEMVALAKKASSMRFNPVVLSDAVLAGALSAAITG